MANCPVSIVYPVGTSPSIYVMTSVLLLLFIGFGQRLYNSNLLFQHRTCFFFRCFLLRSSTHTNVYLSHFKLAVLSEFQRFDRRILSVRRLFSTMSASIRNDSVWTVSEVVLSVNVLPSAFRLQFVRYYYIQRENFFVSNINIILSFTYFRFYVVSCKRIFITV